MRHRRLTNLLDGAATVLQLWPPPVRHRLGGQYRQQSVADAFAQDWENVARDLDMAITRVYGPPADVPRTLTGRPAAVQPFTLPVEIVNPWMADEADHCREMEERYLRAEQDDAEASRREQRRGRRYTLILAGVALLAGTTTACLGQKLTGSVFGGGGLVGLISVLDRSGMRRDRPADV